MVVAGKIFKLSQSASTVEIASKLSGYHIEAPFEKGDYKFKLITEVVGLETKRGVVSGVFSNDYVTHVFHRGNSALVPQTVKAAFSFTHVESNVFLTVVERKRVANLVANKLSEVLFEKVGAIVEAKIPPETLKFFHDKNPEDTKITFFDDVDIPNVDKL